LIFRPQPLHDSLCLLRSALVIERHEAGDDFGIGKVARPAVGISNRSVEAVVQLAQYQ
jgi:hypothetical protein